ncbi:squalene synthase HpnD [Lautropia dentalis]|jgi:squalene synthase hpnD|uniref:Squalene synthase HpnD n=1 Tax=Lautropia dentalis TaxID=2490857 RepID=A0A3R8LSY7_9BURK|nr:presqualene diphosphate synthase HpnD [Lautropia dentalis]RRN45982.1 squalene synthase HpnD [Lautropia dentalis]
MTPDEYCQDKAVQSGSSFYYSFLFLPPERRRAITALYAWCRELDDVADSQGDRGVARRKLDWWAQEVRDLYAGAPTHPVTRALQPFLAPFGIQRRQLMEVIDGMRMDLDDVRYLDFESLKLYCRRAAGVVGEMSAGIFGYSDAQTLVYADRLGLAFQLTNIIRDVGEDARMGRVYLPQQDLIRHGLSRQQFLSGRAGLEEQPAFRALMAEQAARARDAYREAFAALPEVDRNRQRPGLIMAAIYVALLDEIERSGYAVLNQRIALTPLRKFWLACRTRATGRAPRIAS